MWRNKSTMCACEHVFMNPIVVLSSKVISLMVVSQSFGELVHKPLLVDLTVEEGQRLKVIYGSCAGFHAVDVDSGSVYDIYLPTHVRAAVVSGFFSFFLVGHPPRPTPSFPQMTNVSGCPWGSLPDVCSGILGAGV